MQLVAIEANASEGHAPDEPVHVSATSHWPADPRQVTMIALKASTHVLALPEHRSPASLSHAPACDVPVQVVVLAWKPSVGHAPDVPVQLSATSH